MYFMSNTRRTAHGVVCQSRIENCKMGLLPCNGNHVRPLAGNTSDRAVTPSGILSR